MRCVTFGDKHSYRDWGLITNSIEIGIPSAKTSYIDIPGGHGTLDLSAAFGGVKYSDRTLTFVFTMLHTDPVKKSHILNYLHGTRLDIVIDDDSEYYYKGRCTASAFDNDKTVSILTVQAACDPFKYKKAVTVHKQPVTGEGSFILPCDRMQTCPTITADSAFILQYNGIAYEISAGTCKVLDVQLTEGYNRFNASGTGTLIFTYQEGSI